jgi:ferritin-like metal-binding protein YciE
MAEIQIREQKLIQYLNESYGKEKELETSLQAHITMAQRDAYKKRLKKHLTETKSHARDVQKRIKQLGGKAEAGPLPEAVLDVAAAVQTGGKKAAAAAQGPIHALRGTSAAEKQLKNAKTEYSEEHEEIANYTAIETLAEALGDNETAKLARAIRRDEERMASFLEKQIATLTKEVVREEIPSDQRKQASSSRRRSSSSSRSRASSNSKSSSSSKSRSRSSSSRAKSSRSKSGGSKSGSRSR